MRQMSYSLVRIGVYEKLKTNATRDGKLHPMHLVLAAGTAGGLGGIAGNPAGLFRRKAPTRLTDSLHRYSPGSDDQ
jgi:hypothetical protein